MLTTSRREKRKLFRLKNDSGLLNRITGKVKK